MSAPRPLRNLSVSVKSSLDNRHLQSYSPMGDPRSLFANQIDGVDSTTSGQLDHRLAHLSRPDCISAYIDTEGVERIFTELLAAF